jgi:hypothetical protein
MKGDMKMKARWSERTIGHRLRGGGVILAILLLVTLLGPGRAAGAVAPAAPQQAALPAGLSAGDWASMQDLMEAAQYQVTWQVQDGEWAYRAPNPAHDLSLAFAADGLTATRYGDEREPLWEFGLALVAYGDHAFTFPINRGDLTAHRERVAYHWDDRLTEWYVNSAEGVEHGLTLAAPPAGSHGSPVELTFALRGSLTPELYGGGQALRLKDGDGSTALLYDQLAVYDAAGESLPARMRLAGCAPGRQAADCTLRLVIDAASAAYPLTVDPLLHRQVAKLTASDAADDDHFGTSVAISGDTVVVGANLEDGAGSDRGAAYVFERNQGGADGWGQVQKLAASDTQNEDYFGGSVAISGDTVVVGAAGEDGAAASNRGAAYVFERNQGGPDSWGQVQKLTASDAEGSDFFGTSVAISGDTAVVGASGEDGLGSERGAAYVFERNQGGADNWGQVAKLAASDTQNDDYFGRSVAISGDTVVVGADLEAGAGSSRGAAYVFARNHGGADGWGQVQKLTASDAQNGDYFGWSVAISGDTVAVGAYGEDGAGSDRGAAYVFERNQGGPDSWDQVTKLTGSDAQNGDNFGRSVAISGDTVVAGAYGEDGAGSSRGAAYVFERNQDGADSWGEVEKLTASDAGDYDHFGGSVAISGDTVVAGADYEDGAGNNRGAAYIFVADDGCWQEVAIPRASDAGDYDHFGGSVAISGDTVVVGAYREGGAGYDRGAAYVFARNQSGPDSWGEVTKLAASDAEDVDCFGTSVAISGDTVVVGAHKEDGAGDYPPYNDRGAAYVFERNQDGADGWGEVTKLTASDTEDGDLFGNSVAISGDTIVVGAEGEDGAGISRGAAYLFARNYDPNNPSTPLADNWGEATKLTASDAENNDYFGRSVAISGDTVVVGADLEAGAGRSRGAAYVFARNHGGADSWGQVQKLTASDAADDDHFGISVSISGDTVVVGAHQDSEILGPQPGAAYVFARNQGGLDSWGEVQKLAASDAENGDYFGTSVAISGDTVVVGAVLEDGLGSGGGAAYVFKRNQGGLDSWGQVQKLAASDAENGDYFGTSVSISGDTVVVGADREDGAGHDRGAAYVFNLRTVYVYLPLVLKDSP